MPEKKTVFIVMKVELEHPIHNLAAKIAGKAHTTQGVASVEAAETGDLTDGQLSDIARANSFAPLNEDGTLAQAPD